MGDIEDAQNRWRRRRRQHEQIGDGVDDTIWGLGNLNDALHGRRGGQGCALAVAAGAGVAAAVAVFFVAMGRTLA